MEKTSTQNSVEQQEKTTAIVSETNSFKQTAIETYIATNEALQEDERPYNTNPPENIQLHTVPSFSTEAQVKMSQTFYFHN